MRSALTSDIAAHSYFSGESIGQYVLTKLAVPATPSDFVCRPRLLLGLDASWHLELFLVVAPAGFGKTTLICDWVRQQKNAVAWLTLDTADNRFSRFLQYLCAALKMISPGLGEITLGRLHANPLISVSEAMSCLCDELAETTKDFVIVLDDCHFVSAPVIHESISFFVSHMPQNCHLVMGSRTVPALPLGRWRSQHRIGELKPQELRFHLDEILEFYENALGLRIEDTVGAALEARTEGWGAALRLAAINARHKDDPQAFLARSTGENLALFDYFLEEAFGDLPTNTQKFLIYISILDRFSGPLCEAVTGQKGGEAVLYSLLRMNMFIFLLDEETHWFRFHHLFAAALSDQLARQDKDGSLTARLHLKAAIWFEDQGLLDEALNHYIAGQDYFKAGLLVEKHGLDLLKQSDQITLSDWLEKLPRDVVASSAWLLVYSLAGCLLSHNLEAAGPLLQQALVAASGCPDESLILGTIETLQGFVALHKHVDPSFAIDHTKKALEYFPEDGHRAVRELAFLIMGSGYLKSGDIPEALRLYEKSYYESLRAGNFNIFYRAAGNLADLQTAMGGLDQASATCFRALDASAAVSGRNHFFAGRVYVCLGAIARERNQLGQAERYIAKALSLAERAGDSDVTALASLVEARILIARGDVKGARLKFQQVDAPGAEFSTILWDAGLRAELLLDLHLLCNDTAAAEKIVRYRRLALSGLPTLFMEPESYGWLRLLLATGQANSAALLSNALVRHDRKEEVHGRYIKSLIFLALARKAEKKTDQALEVFVQALDLAESQGHIRSFLDEGAAIGELLASALSSGKSTVFVKQLMAEWEKEWSALSPLDSPAPLSVRELEVMRLLAAGLANRDIAEHLGLAHGTIKAHLSNIFKKFMVSNRSQAIVRARSLGILR